MSEEDFIVSGILPCMRVASTHTSTYRAHGGALTGTSSNELDESSSDDSFLDCELSGCEEPSDNEGEQASGGEDNLVIARPAIEYNKLIAETLAYINTVAGL